MVALKGWACVGTRRDSNKYVDLSAQLLGSRARTTDESDRGSRCNGDYFVLGQSPVVSGEVSEQYVERCVSHYPMNTVYGAQIVLVEQGLLGSEHEEALYLHDDDSFTRVYGGRAS